MSEIFDRRQAGRFLAAAINSTGLPVTRLVVAREILVRTNSQGFTHPVTDREIGDNVSPKFDFPYCSRTVARARRDLVDLDVITAIRTPTGHVYAFDLAGCGGALEAVS